MEPDSLNPPEGPTKGQVVLYSAVGAVGIVFFGLLVWLSGGMVSDTAQTSDIHYKTSTISMSSQPIADPSDSNPLESPQPEQRQFTFEIVASPTLRSQGLSGRADVPQDYGMLFVFPEKSRYSFWMKDMRVPIDIIWLADTVEDAGAASGTSGQARSATIIGIEKNISPDTYPATFTAPAPVRYVLEVAAGETARQGWGIGTTLALPSGIPVPQ